MNRKLDPIYVRVAVLLLAAPLIAGCTISLEAPSLPEHHVERVVERSFPIRPGMALQLRNLAGQMIFEGHDGDLEIHATLHAASDSAAEADEMLASLDVRFEESGADLTAAAVYPVEDRRRYFYPGGEEARGVPMWLASSRTTARYDGARVTVTNSPRDAAAMWVDFVVRVPAGVRITASNLVGTIDADMVPGPLTASSGSGDITATGGHGGLVLDTGSGDILIRDYEGAVRADTGSGDVEVARVSGSVEVDTGSGDVDLTAVDGDMVSADTGSGDVTLDDVAGSIRCDTGSGDVEGGQVRVRGILHVDTGSGDVAFEADLSAAESVELDTSSGDVGLRLYAEVPGLSFNVETSSGDISVRLPGLEGDDSRRRRFRGRTGDGGIPVVIRTGSGDVTVRGPGD